MRRAQPAGGASLRVFEISRAANGRDLGDLEVDLPVALARRHQDVFVVFMHHGSDMGWGAYVTGEDGAVLLSFPWTDHVDRILTGPDSPELPVNVTEEGWDDLEQGWWGRVLVAGSDVYLAETDFDAMTDVSDPHHVEGPGPGIVLVDGVEVQWNVTSKDSYDRAWQRAAEACRRGNPSPTAEWQSKSEGRRVVML